LFFPIPFEVGIQGGKNGLDSLSQKSLKISELKINKVSNWTLNSFKIISKNDILFENFKSHLFLKSFSFKFIVKSILFLFYILKLFKK
jgi:hypothetical protein